MNILVITQESGNHELADLVLQIPGHHVSLASSAEQAIGFIQSSHPGLILLDLRLPKRAGLSLVRRLSQNPRSRHFPHHASARLAKPTSLIPFASRRNCMTRMPHHMTRMLHHTA